MGAETDDQIDRATVAGLIAASGVKLTAAEIDAIAGALARIKGSASVLLPPSLFDQTCELFYRLLESDAASEAGK